MSLSVSFVCATLAPIGLLLKYRMLRREPRVWMFGFVHRPRLLAMAGAIAVTVITTAALAGHPFAGLWFGLLLGCAVASVTDTRLT